MRIITAYIVICCLSICACKTKPNGYQITMTGNYMETNFPLLNGLKIDELEVSSFSKDNIPYEFYLKKSLSLKRCPNTSNKDFIKNLIFFDRPNAGYYWENDSTWGIYDINPVNYKYRGSLSGKDRWDSSYQKQYYICPFAFKSNSWYLIDFIPAEAGEKHHVFLHVDNNNNFIFYELKDLYKGQHKKTNAQQRRLRRVQCTTTMKPIMYGTFGSPV